MGGAPLTGTVFELIESTLIKTNSSLDRYTNQGVPFIFRFVSFGTRLLKFS